MKNLIFLTKEIVTKMNKINSRKLIFRLRVILFALFVMNNLSFAVKKNPAGEDSVFAVKIMKRLITVVENPPKENWPPKFIIDYEMTSINAFATRYGIVLSKQILDSIIKKDPDRMAFVLAHELQHILLGHLKQDVTNTNKAISKYYLLALSRDQEIAADTEGVKLALMANFSYKKFKGVYIGMMQQNLNYSSLEGLGKDHPSFEKRLQFLDNSQAALWRAMGVFNDGVVLLGLEQYQAASFCFKKVTADFPQSYDAWANLGYALLMQYCDNLDPEDIRNLGVGQIIAGGFYRRPASLEKSIRGVDEDLWWDAVAALEKALSKKENLSLTYANLGLAYLVRPDHPDLGKAKKNFESAIALIESDNTVDELAKAGIYVNAGVSFYTDKSFSSGNQMLTKANKSLELFSLSYQRQFLTGYGRELTEKALSGLTQQVDMAMLYNSIIHNDSIMKKSDMEKYLSTESPSSVWWEIIYNHYTVFCDKAKLSAKSKASFVKHTLQYRPVVSVNMKDRSIISLGESLSDILDNNNSFEVIPIIEKTNLVKMVKKDEGIQIIGSEVVLAISINNSSSTNIFLHTQSIGSKVDTIHCGMDFGKLKQLIGEYYSIAPNLNQQKNYFFYDKLGLAFRIDKNNSVSEIIIAQVPKLAKI